MTTDIRWVAVNAPPQLEHDVVHLWRVDLDTCEAAEKRCRSVLAADEHARADRFRASRQSRRFAVTRGTLRHILSGYLHTTPKQLRFAYGTHGKPYLESPQADVRFNVSHSGGVALMAFARVRDLGVDVERTMRDVGWEQVAERFFADSELDQLRALPGDQRRSGFFRCWTSKEAYMKATGRGITLGLGNFIVRVDPALPAELLSTAEGGAGDWWLTQVEPGAGMAGALCVAGGPLEVQYFETTTPTPD
ncbi:MAG: 4'-phosphopantetheinyl transferase superfamily protein [Gemmatimonadetes bacterium]|jgi:4'-phosphopantetheinyl transferase|nr:4'-phosphopantetheinyl transferase superfamily protein [Gemmatimonadota bacterium]MBT5055753.1 4'-phosphopantetheinyl transferase superfamily protein [Gemmatimonadota bacterium]MBT5142290.1 4'-phosphopantetheinyl transferase superfamily protein [Gemmatimonadota bacterium]MBT5589125.1 4'-phosphopantetheinyl transferase superfamily protein [Gemmatimonadota bacterium]MBT5963225.1 4'-phosphopantetheinyl transferase superfamily protein [Gemmatimonadota bacterium]